MPGELTLDVISQGGTLRFEEVSNTTGDGLVFHPDEDKIAIAKQGVYAINFTAKHLFFLNPVNLKEQPAYPHWLRGLRSFTFEVEGVPATEGKKEWRFSIPTDGGLLDPVIVNQVEGGG